MLEGSLRQSRPRSSGCSRKIRVRCFRAWRALNAASIARMANKINSFPCPARLRMGSSEFGNPRGNSLILQGLGPGPGFQLARTTSHKEATESGSRKRPPRFERAAAPASRGPRGRGPLPRSECPALRPRGRSRTFRRAHAALLRLRRVGCDRRRGALRTSSAGSPSGSRSPSPVSFPPSSLAAECGRTLGPCRSAKERPPG